MIEAMFSAALKKPNTVAFASETVHSPHSRNLAHDFLFSFGRHGHTCFLTVSRSVLRMSRAPVACDGGVAQSQLPVCGVLQKCTNEEVT